MTLTIKVANHEQVSDLRAIQKNKLNFYIWIHIETKRNKRKVIYTYG